ncbi:aminoglycoside phosphotransferase family protein [Pseudomonas aeruginosa]|nr:aminoglycoside phosphotransferase family protein [Pseudomonas aeruginosa]
MPRARVRCPGRDPAGALWFDSLYAAERALRRALRRLRERRPLPAGDRSRTAPVAGDIHHGNVLDWRARLASHRPQTRLYGERGYDYANLFTNPDAKTAQAPGRFRAPAGDRRRRQRPERAAACCCGSWPGPDSAAWFDEDGSREETDAELAIARLALASLSREG